MRPVSCLVQLGSLRFHLRVRFILSTGRLQPAGQLLDPVFTGISLSKCIQLFLESIWPERQVSVFATPGGHRKTCACSPEIADSVCSGGEISWCTRQHAI